MTALNHKKILLGVSGGIAAYKSAVLARRLMDAGATVRVVMTHGAQAFIQPMTFQALTGNPVHTELLDAEAEAAMGHIELARWADIILVAPASANTLARLAHGLADDLLSTLCLATDAPVFVAPAMNRLMWANPATVRNCALLQASGVGFIGPAEGAQACGETGKGRLLEPEQIRDELSALVSAQLIAATGSQTSTQSEMLSGTQAQASQPAPSASLANKQILITAGPTREPIDPVRYISNHSSGKMGFAIAEAARLMGAQVTLVAGPVSLSCHEQIHRVDVTTAEDMLNAVMGRAKTCDIFISVAAVADYRLETVTAQKIKKNNETMQLSLVKNPDILKTVAELNPRPFCVGFAAETEKVADHAREKLARKKLDMIAANHVGQTDNPVFGSDTNALDVFSPEKSGPHSIAAASKTQVAQELMQLIAERINTDS